MTFIKAKIERLQNVLGDFGCLLYAHNVKSFLYFLMPKKENHFWQSLTRASQKFSQKFLRQCVENS